MTGLAPPRLSVGWHQLFRRDARLLLAAALLATVALFIFPAPAFASSPQDETVVAVPFGPGADAQGDVDAIAPTADQRRQRARRLSRSPVARERVVNADGSITFVLHNLLHAPVTVQFEPGNARGASIEMLAQARTTIAALKPLDVARIRADSPLAPGEVIFFYTAVIGDPAAIHDDRVVYAWPFPEGTDARLTQGPGGPTHRDAYSHDAIDLAVAEGTPVLAARAGTVVFLESRYFESGLDRAKYLSRANQVRILHDDGSMASYAHLQPASINLEPGQRVEVGEQIGLSGNTGFSSGPHLHFVVLVHRDMAMVSVPFRMRRINAP